MSYRRLPLIKGRTTCAFVEFYTYRRANIFRHLQIPSDQ